jgi:uncharacterized protein (TIGR02268 family)
LLQPSTWALLLLLLGAVARAQPAPSPAHRQRSLTVTGNPAAPVPEVRGAKGLGIAFHFDGPILQESVKVDEAFIRVVDVGKKSLLVELVAEPREDQPSEVSVTFADGEQERAAFRIVPHPSEVDTWIEVTRRTEQLGAACQERLDELRARYGAQSPTAFRRSRLLRDMGIQARTFALPSSMGGLESDGGISFRGGLWMLLEVEIRNRTGQAWAPRVATLKSKNGTPVTVRGVTAAHETIAPGELGKIWVETDDPPASEGVIFTLEVSGTDGRVLRAEGVELAPRTQEGKR